MDDLHIIIDRVYRSTRNQDVLTICEELKRKLVGEALIDAARGRDAKVRQTRAEIQRRYRQRKRRKAEGTLP